MKNPIPHSGFFATPTLEELDERIQGLPAEDQAIAYSCVMMALNACHALVEQAMYASSKEEVMRLENEMDAQRSEAYDSGYNDGYNDGRDEWES